MHMGRRASSAVTTFRNASRWLAIGALGFVGACQSQQSTDDALREGGQTGSPIAPDRVTPVPYAPPQDPPGGGGPSPDVPDHVIQGDKLTARADEALYVINSGTLRAFDASETDHLRGMNDPLPEAASRWVSVTDDSLSVLASVVDPAVADLENAAELRAFRFNLTDPLRPELLGSLALPGQFLQARSIDDRLIVLSGEYAPPTCHPSSGYGYGGYAPETLTVSELSPSDDGWQLTDQVSVVASGFIETERGFVLIHDEFRAAFSQAQARLHSVIIDPEGGLVEHPPVSPGERVNYWAPMATSDDRVAFFQHRVTEVVLRVMGSDGVDTERVVPVSAEESPRRSEDWVPIAGRFALVLGSEGGPGAALDWQADGGPVVIAELPEDLLTIAPVGEHWLGVGVERSLLFSLDVGNGMTVEHEFAGRPELDRAVFGMHWVNAQQRVLVPHIVPGSGIGSIPGKYALVALDLTQMPPVWGAPIELHGDPWLRDGRHEFLALQDVGSELFALTDASGLHFVLPEQRILERVDPEQETSSVAAFTTSALEAATSAEWNVTLAADFEQHPELICKGASGDEQTLTSEYRATSLAAVDSGVLAYSLGYTNECYPGGASLSEDSVPCTTYGTAGLAHVQLGSAPQLKAQVPMPASAADYAGASLTSEWLELMAHGDQVGVVEHVGVRCQGERECDALGIPYEITETRACPDDDDECAEDEVTMRDVARGHRSERWLYPFDLERGRFLDGQLLGHTEPHGTFTGAALEVNDGVAIVEVIPEWADIDADVRLRLRRATQMAELASTTGIPIAGFPMLVSDNIVISIEPAGKLPEAGGRVGANVNLMQLRDGAAYLLQTLSLPEGHVDHGWVEDRGVVLTLPEDRCAEGASAELVAVQLQDEELSEAGRVQVPGTSWRLAETTRDLIVLRRWSEDFEQLAIIDWADDMLTFREILTHASSGDSYMRHPSFEIVGSDVHWL